MLYLAIVDRPFSTLSLVLTSDPLTTKLYLSCFSAFHYPSPAHKMACLMSSCGPDFQDPGVKEGYPWAQLLGRGRVPVQAGYCPSPSSAVSSYQNKVFLYENTATPLTTLLIQKLNESHVGAGVGLGLVAPSDLL